MTDLIRIDVACNDPDNGNFAHVAQMIEVGADRMLELEPVHYDSPPRFVETPKGFRLSGKNWPTRGSADWVGNWCWNAYSLELETAVEFLIWLRRRNLYRCTTGWCEFYEWWNRPPAPTTPPLLKQILSNKLRAA